MNGESRTQKMVARIMTLDENRFLLILSIPLRESEFRCQNNSDVILKWTVAEETCMKTNAYPTVFRYLQSACITDSAVNSPLRWLQHYCRYWP